MIENAQFSKKILIILAVRIVCAVYYCLETVEKIVIIIVMLKLMDFVIELFETGYRKCKSLNKNLKIFYLQKRL